MPRLPTLVLLALLAAAPLRAAPAQDLTPWLQQLSSTDPAQREQAATELGRRGAEAAAAVAPLVAALGDGDAYVRGAAAVALGRIGPAAVPALVRVLDDGLAPQRVGAATALGRLGPDAAPALPALQRHLQDPLAAVRLGAAVALGELGPAGRPAAPALTDALADRDESVRQAAARSLARLLPDDPSRPPDLARVVATLDRWVPTLLAEHRVPGLAVALLQDRQLVWSRGYGLREAGGAAPVTPDTVFEVASMSKPVLALLAMQRVDEDLLDLDRPLPPGPVPLLPGQPEARRVTARMLMSHTAGYPNWRPGGEEAEGPLVLLHPPGARFTYSGEGTGVLQQALEQQAGEPLQALAERRLFGPLGLQRSSFVWTPALGAVQATGHDVEGRPLPPGRYRHAHAGYTLHSSVRDYAQLLAQVLQAVEGRSSPLSQGAARAMLQPQVTLSDRAPIGRPGAARGQTVHWGLGWSLNTTEQGPIAHHSGVNRTGYCSFSQFSPERGTGLVILTNGAQGAELWARLVSAVGAF
jgi:CubicO group peptidase (beta-lactamase class C family)